MKLANQILASVLLCIYSIVVLHTAVPHSHEAQHDAHTSEATVVAQSHSTHEHSHDHGHLHHHHNHDESNSDWLEYLLHAFGDLHHSDAVQSYFDNIIIQKNELDFSQGDLLFAAITISVIYGDFGQNSTEAQDFIDPPPLLRDQYQYISDPLRGPPSLS